MPPVFNTALKPSFPHRKKKKIQLACIKPKARKLTNAVAIAK